jgi:uncharacterized membrane protein YoaK (UPF0700 family)
MEVCAFVLATAAGMVNAIALLGFNHQGVSHLSGIATLFGIELAHTNAGASLHLAAMIASFVIGAAASGLIVGSEPLKLGHRYAYCLTGESLLLLGAMLMLSRGSPAGHYLAAAACGLQNAMTSTFTGSIIRTTHITGIITDLGVALGLKLRGESAGTRRVVLYLLLILGFCAGGSLGAVSFLELDFRALLVPAALIAVLALAAFLKTPPPDRTN